MRAYCLTSEEEWYTMNRVCCLTSILSLTSNMLEHREMTGARRRSMLQLWIWKITCVARGASVFPLASERNLTDQGLFTDFRRLCNFPKAQHRLTLGFGYASPGRSVWGSQCQAPSESISAKFPTQSPGGVLSCLGEVWVNTQALWPSPFHLISRGQG